MLQGGLPQDYRELREPSVPDLSEVFGQVWISATSSVKITFPAVACFAHAPGATFAYASPSLQEGCQLKCLCKAYQSVLI